MTDLGTPPLGYRPSMHSIRKVLVRSPEPGPKRLRFDPWIDAKKNPSKEDEDKKKVERCRAVDLKFWEDGHHWQGMVATMMELYPPDQSMVARRPCPSYTTPEHALADHSNSIGAGGVRQIIIAYLTDFSQPYLWDLAMRNNASHLHWLRSAWLASGLCTNFTPKFTVCCSATCGVSMMPTADAFVELFASNADPTFDRAALSFFHLMQFDGPDALCAYSWDVVEHYASRFPLVVTSMVSQHLNGCLRQIVRRGYYPRVRNFVQDGDYFRQTVLEVDAHTRGVISRVEIAACKDGVLRSGHAKIVLSCAVETGDIGVMAMFRCRISADDTMALIDFLGMQREYGTDDMFAKSCAFMFEPFWASVPTPMFWAIFDWCCPALTGRAMQILLAAYRGETRPVDVSSFTVKSRLLQRTIVMLVNGHAQAAAMFRDRFGVHGAEFFECFYQSPMLEAGHLHGFVTHERGPERLKVARKLMPEMNALFFFLNLPPQMTEVIKTEFGLGDASPARGEEEEEECDEQLL